MSIGIDLTQSFLWLHNILWYECTRTYSTIYLLKDFDVSLDFDTINYGEVTSLEV